MVNQLVHLGRFRASQYNRYESFLEQEKELTEFVINVYFDFDAEITGFNVQYDNSMHLSCIALPNLADYGNLSHKHQ